MRRQQIHSYKPKNNQKKKKKGFEIPETSFSPLSLYLYSRVTPAQYVEQLLGNTPVTLISAKPIKINATQDARNHYLALIDSMGQTITALNICGVNVLYSRFLASF